MRYPPRLLSRRRAVGAFALVGAMLVCTASAQAADSWAAGKALTSARFMLGAVAAPEGTIYVLGGINGSSDVNTAETYSPTPAPGAWATLPSMSYFRSSEGVAVGGDGRIYAFGGNGGLASSPSGDSGNLLSSAEAYNPSTTSWQAVPDLPTPRAGMAAVGDIGSSGNGDVYVFGGWDGIGDGYLADNLRYDPTTNTWATMAPMPTPREYASAVLGSDGDIYVIGGLNDNGSLATVEIYNPTTDHWTTGPSLTTAEYGGSAAVVQSRIFVFGGYDGNEALSDTQEFTVGGSAWGSDTAVPRVRYLGAAAVSTSLKVWVFGGLGATGPLAATDVFSSVDTTPPTGNVSINDAAAATNSFTVSVNATATDPSGVTNILLSSKSAVGSNGLLSQGDEQAYVPDTPISWDLTNATYGGSTTQGARWVYVQWEDGAGNWSTVHGDWITVDTIPPVITAAPAPRLMANTILGAGTFPINIYWTGSDAGATPPSYYLKYTCNGGTTWSSVSLSPTTVMQANRALARGVNCQFEVAAHDLVNTSAYSLSRVFHGSVLQETAPSITRTGTWSIGTSSSYDGGHDRYSTKTNSSMAIKFTGTGIAWVAPTGPTRGSARVYIDGVLSKTVSLYTTAAGYRKLVYQHMWTTSGTHTLKIVVAGTKNRPRVDADAFLVLS